MELKKQLISPEAIASFMHLHQAAGGELLTRFLMQLTKLDKVNALYDRHWQNDAAHFIEKALNELQVTYKLNDSDLSRIPTKGAFITVSNHPLGGIDGLILMDLILKKRPDFKVMGNFLLSQCEPLKPIILSVNPFEDYKDKKSSYQGMRASLGHLAEGKPLGIFPSGEVSTFQNDAKVVVDKAWSESVTKLIRKANVPVVPIYFEGKNSLLFHILGKIHPLLRTARLPSELFNKEGKSVSIRIGSAISTKSVNEFDSNPELTKFIRAKTYSLGSKIEVPKFFAPKGRLLKKEEPIVEAIPSQLLADEIELACKEFLLFKQDHFQIFCAPASKIPKVLNELGRLREITFREVGEGTLKSRDLDPFDLYYHHLVIWDQKESAIVGAYRLCKGKIALHQHGKKGFYLSTLFKMDDKILPILEQSIELGRSFIVKEYQRKPMSLFMLWKGIFYYLLKNSEYRYLIGPVSISKDFSKFSQALIVEFVKAHYFDSEIGQYIKPRKQFRIKTDKRIDPNALLNSLQNNINKLDAFIKDIEFGFGAPVLLKKYLKLNAKIVGFNVDPLFNHTLDGLVVVDVFNIDADFIRSLSKEVNDPDLLDRFNKVPA